MPAEDAASDKDRGTPGAVSELEEPTFRDHIPTVDQQGKRIWIYPRKPRGRFTNARNLVSLFLLAFLFLGPFLRIGGNPVLMFNVVERRFAILGQIFWPQDIYLFVLMMLVVFVMIVLFTAVYGRIWCGWLCPQTILMENVFRKIEYWIDGDSHEQRKLAKAPWRGPKIFKRTLKYSIFLVVSVVISHFLLMFVIGSDAVMAILKEGWPAHPAGMTAMTFFSLLVFGIFARFREQACTFVCPYGRFQSVILDNHSIVVAYDFERGEKRHKVQRGQTRDERLSLGQGDCINCRMCVSVCPTGIDIRNGTQMECVNCTACIDACDNVMDKLNFPRGLIRYASHNNIRSKERFKVTGRMVIYTLVLLLLTGLLGFLLMSRNDVDATLLRSPGSLYQIGADGEVTNLYLLKVTNKSATPMKLEIELMDMPGRAEIAGGTLNAAAQQLSQGAVIVTLPQGQLDGPNTHIRLRVLAEGEEQEVVKTNFLGPTRGGGHE